MVLVPTDLVIQTPEDHVLVLAARSSLFGKHSCILANSIGIVDSDYSGMRDAIFVPLFNAGSFVTIIEEGERFAQGLFLPVSRAEFVVVKEVAGASRGGFGSTG